MHKLVHTSVAVIYSGGSVVSPLRGSGFSSQYLATDIEYLHRISCDQTIHGDFTLEMAIRGTLLILFLSVFFILFWEHKIEVLYYFQS